MDVDKRMGEWSQVEYSDITWAYIKDESVNKSDR